MKDNDENHKVDDDDDNVGNGNVMDDWNDDNDAGAEVNVDH